METLIRYFPLKHRRPFNLARNRVGAHWFRWAVCESAIVAGIWTPPICSEVAMRKPNEAPVTLGPQAIGARPLTFFLVGRVPLLKTDYRNKVDDPTYSNLSAENSGLMVVSILNHEKFHFLRGI